MKRLYNRVVRLGRRGHNFPEHNSSVEERSLSCDQSMEQAAVDTIIEPLLWFRENGYSSEHIEKLIFEECDRRENGEANARG